MKSKKMINPAAELLLNFRCVALFYVLFSIELALNDTKYHHF